MSFSSQFISLTNFLSDKPFVFEEKLVYHPWHMSDIKSPPTLIISSCAWIGAIVAAGTFIEHKINLNGGLNPLIWFLGGFLVLTRIGWLAYQEDKKAKTLFPSYKFKVFANHVWPFITMALGSTIIISLCDPIEVLGFHHYLAFFWFSIYGLCLISVPKEIAGPLPFIGWACFNAGLVFVLLMTVIHRFPEFAYLYWGAVFSGIHFFYAVKLCLVKN
jgi:hypothetical protein